MDMEASDDRHLLREFAECGSETAFRTLVERHLGLVHASALRQLNDHHLAEEVTQTVFILLAQKAARLSHRCVVAGWLHRTTHFIAQRTLRAEKRRRDREQEVFAMQDSGTTIPQADWSDLAPVLDQALLELSDLDRHAILLRFFQHRNHREVAAALDLGEEAAKKRVTRALERLRGILGQWGVSVSLSMLGTLLSEHGVEASPAHLTSPILIRALSPNPAQSSSPTMAHLVSAALEAWHQTNRLRVAGWLIGGIASLTLVLAPFIPSSLARWRNPVTPVDPPAADDTFSFVPSDTEPASMNTTLPAIQDATHRELLLAVVDPSTGQGIPDAEVQVRDMSWDNGPEEPTRQRTDSNGVACVRFETRTQHIIIGALAPGRTPRCVRFDPHRGGIIPERYTLRLPSTEHTIGGTLLSPEGHPVANAELRIQFFSGGDYSNREPEHEYTGTANIDGTVIGHSGADGRWTCSLIPKAHPGFLITAHHLDYPPTLVIQVPGGLAPNPDTAQHLDTHQKLWARQLTTTLKRPLQLVGKVTDSLGRPIANARLLHSPDNWNQRQAHTDDKGHFRWQNLNQGPFEFTVLAPGHGPRQIRTEVAADSPPVDVALSPSALLRLRIVDPAGAGVEGARAIPEAWDGALYFAMNKSDADGRIEWQDAPANEPILLYVAKFGWGERRNVSVIADASEHEIVLSPTPRIRGRVLDADSRQPIAEFKAIPSDRGPYWARGSTQFCRNGDLQLAFMDAVPPYRFRIEAEGYLPYVHESLPSNSFPSDPLEIRLQVADPAQSIHGIVLQPNGKPAAEVQVRLNEKISPVLLVRRSLARQADNPLTIKTDAEGQFRFPAEASGSWLIAAGETGYAMTQPAAPGAPSTLQLQAWGRIEGRIDLAERSRPDQSVWLDLGSVRNAPLLFMSTPKVEPDSEGWFVFDSVPAGKHIVSLRIADAPPGHHRTSVAVEPGRTTEVHIAEPGPRVNGRLVFQGRGDDPVLRTSLAVTFAASDLPVGNPGPFFKPLPPEEAEQRAAEIRRLHDLRSGVVVAYPDAEGRFATPEGLAPGEYRLGIHHSSLGPVVTSVNGRPGRVDHADEIMRQMRWQQLITSRPDIAEILIHVPSPREGAAPEAIHDLGDIAIPLPPQP